MSPFGVALFYSLTTSPLPHHHESMFNKIMSVLNRSDKNTNRQKGFVGEACTTSAYNFLSTMNCYKYGSYDNTFPNISRISEAFAEVMPYAVDQDGKRLETQPQLIAALYNPNKQMSGVDFFEALIVMALVHPTVYVLCWHRQGKEAVPGGPVTANNVCGFTFLQDPSVVIEGGHKTYRQNSQVYHENDVIEISLNVNPYDITSGYSPSLAAKKWSNIDDYIAEFQAGFFRNGAVPAGEFIVTAATVEEYNDTVDKLQAQHRGAGANNNVVYVHRPTNSIDGAPLNAQIEWVPFSQANKDMTLQALFDQANKKIDMDFGVPQEVKGYLQNSNYASVEVADYIFARRVVYPKLVKIWSKFTHEMNRITGGLGFAISFDYELPVLSETRNGQLNNLLSAVNAGYTLESAVEALQLPKSFLMLRTPDEPEETVERQDIEPENTQADADQLETSTKSVCCGCHAKVKAITPNPELQKAVEDYTKSQIEAAKEGKEFDEKKGANAFALLMLPIVLSIILESGKKQYAQGEQQAGADNLPAYDINESLRTSYEEYLEKVALSYTLDTAASIKRVLAQSDYEQWGYEELRERLDEIMNTDYWRVERLTRTETHRAEQYGAWDAMRVLAAEANVEIVKIWHVNPGSPNPCSICLDLDGKRLPLGETFGDFPVGADEVADAHPNCSCYLTFEIVEKPKRVKVVCPACGRYMFESEGGVVKSVICANSKCKKHFDFEIKNGNINAKEVK